MLAACGILKAEVGAMHTKEQLLALLENHRGQFFSGEEIARRLELSRTAVWKAVKTLRAEGYPIEAVQNRGYCLSAESDVLSAQGVAKYLGPACAGLTLEVLPTVGSTNEAARARAIAGAPEGLVVLAMQQTQGRGRQGRSFFSPPDTGVYLSLVLRPRQYAAAQAVRLTTMAAVAACEAIEAVSERPAQIKWVNDIYVEGRKVCGILTEAAVAVENGMLEYVVLGVGVNVLPPREGFPPELAGTAGAVLPAPRSDAKNRLAAAFLDRFMACYADPPAGLWQAYRSRSLVLGRQVLVLAGGDSRPAEALDIDEDFRLLVAYEDGTRERLFSGEVSLQLPPGTKGETL